MAFTSFRWIRWLLFGGAALVALPVLVLILLQIPPVATRVMQHLLRLVPLNPGYALEAGAVSGNWITGLELTNVRLLHEDRVLARIDRLRLAYDPRQLLGQHRRVRVIVVDEAEATARRDAEGWDLANAFRRSADTAGGGSFGVQRLAIRDVRLAAVLGPDSTLRVRDLVVEGRDLTLGEVAVLRVDTLAAQVAPPGRSPHWFGVAGRGGATAEEFRLDPVRVRTERSEVTGRLILPRRLDDPRMVDRLAVRLEAAPLALSDLAAIVPSVPSKGVLRFEARAEAEGRTATGHVTARLEDAALELRGSTELGTGAPASYGVRGTLRGLDPRQLLRTAPTGVVNGEFTVDLRGPSLDRVDGRLDLRIANSRLAEIAIDRLELGARFEAGRAGIALRGAIGGGTTTADGWVRPFDSVPDYRLAGRVRRPPGTDSLVRQWVGTEGDPVLDVGFRVAGRGLSLDLARLDGRVILAAVRQDGGRTRLGTAALRLAERRLEVRPELDLAGGRISALATAWLDDTVRYQVHRGIVENVDLGRLTGDTLLAPVSGRFTLVGRGAAPAEAVAVARIELDELRRGAQLAEGARAEVQLDRGSARMAARAALAGGRLVLAADVRPFESPRRFTIRRAALERVSLGALLDRPDLDGPLTVRIRGSGRWGEEVRSFRGRLEVDRSRLGRVAIDGGALVVDFRGERLAYDGDLRTNGGIFQFAGEARPLADAPALTLREGRLRGVDLGVLLGRADLQTDLNGRLSAAATRAGADSLEGELALELLPSRVNEAELQAGELTLALDGGAVTGDLRLASADGELRAALAGRAAGDRREGRAEGILRLTRLDRWTGREVAAGELAADFALAGVGDSAGLLTVGGRISATGTVGGLRLDSLLLALRPEPGTIRVDTALVRSNAVVLDGAGRVALRPGAGTDTLRLVGRARDLTPALALAGADSVLLDSARIALTVTGPAWHWRIGGEAAAYRLLYAGSLAERLLVRAAVAVDSTRLGGISGELRTTGAAVGRLAIKEAAVKARYDSVVALEVAAQLREETRLAARVRGEVRGDTVRARVERLELVEDEHSWRLEQPARLVLGPWIEIDGFALRSGNRRIILDGAVDLHGSSDLALRIDGLDLETLQRLGLAPVGGRLDGLLTLTGQAEAPRLEGRLGLRVRRGDGDELGRIGTTLAWSREGLRFDAAAVSSGGGRLAATGSLPWRFSLSPADSAARIARLGGAADTLGIALQADSLELSLFEPLLPPETARDLRGMLALDARLTGTPDRPRTDGRLGVTGVHVTLPTIGVTYEKGELLGTLADDALRIERLRLRTGDDEELTAQGTVRLRPLANPALSLTAELRDFQVSNSSTMRIEASGRAQLTGTLAEPSLTGTVRLGRSEIFQGSGAQRGEVEEVELTPEDLQELAAHFGPGVLAEADEGGSLLDRFRLDLGVRLPGQVWFRRRESPQMAIELSGQLQIRQEPGEEMQIFGRVEPTPGRGTIDLYGREFRLTGGEIALNGPVDSLRLDVSAEYQVPVQAGPEDEGIIVTVQAQGRPDSLALEFASQPEMGREDILSYIVTGQPASENPLAGQLGGGASGEEFAVAQLAQAVTGVAGEALGLDVFQIEQDGLRGLTLTAGRYVASRLYLSIQQPLQLGTDAQRRPGTQLGPGFELEYTFRPWLRFTGRGGSLPPRFFLRTHYAY